MPTNLKMFHGVRLSSLLNGAATILVYKLDSGTIVADWVADVALGSPGLFSPFQGEDCTGLRPMPIPKRAFSIWVVASQSRERKVGVLFLSALTLWSGWEKGGGILFSDPEQNFTPTARGLSTDVCRSGT